MREITEFEVTQISAGIRNTDQSMITISGLIVSGAIYLFLVNEIELSTSTKVGIGVLAVGLCVSLFFLRAINQQH